MENTVYNFIVENLLTKTRLDVYLCNHIKHLSRNQIITLIKHNLVTIDNKVVNKPSYNIQNNNNITVKISNIPSNNTIVATDIKINILYEDDYYIAVYKPKGLVVHPGAGNYNNTLANALVYKYNNLLSTVNGTFRPGIIHRIDKDTSGVLLIAKTNSAHHAIASQFAEHTIVRNYRALVWGVPILKVGTINTVIGRDKKNRIKMSINTSAKHKIAITNYNLIASYKNILGLLDLQLQTGRTHQIRAHMEHMGYNVVGDKLYGAINNKHKNLLNATEQNLIAKLQGQALHAYKLEFLHPFLHKTVSITCQESDELLEIYKYFNLI